MRRISLAEHHWVDQAPTYWQSTVICKQQSELKYSFTHLCAHMLSPGDDMLRYRANEAKSHIRLWDGEWASWGRLFLPWKSAPPLCSHDLLPLKYHKRDSQSQQPQWFLRFHQVSPPNRNQLCLIWISSIRLAARELAKRFTPNCLMGTNVFIWFCLCRSMHLLLQALSLKMHTNLIY